MYHHNPLQSMFHLHLHNQSHSGNYQSSYPIHIKLILIKRTFTSAKRPSDKFVITSNRFKSNFDCKSNAPSMPSHFETANNLFRFAVAILFVYIGSRNFLNVTRWNLGSRLKCHIYCCDRRKKSPSVSAGFSK